MEVLIIFLFIALAFGILQLIGFLEGILLSLITTTIVGIFVGRETDSFILGFASFYLLLCVFINTTEEIADNAYETRQNMTTLMS